MAKWERKLDLAPEWQQAEDHEIAVQQLATVVAKRLEALQPFVGENESLEREKQVLVEEFQDLSEDEDADTDDFDILLTALYDWADTSLDDNWNGRKACWISRY